MNKLAIPKFDETDLSNLLDANVKIVNRFDGGSFSSNYVLDIDDSLYFFKYLPPQEHVPSKEQQRIIQLFSKDLLPYSYRREFTKRTSEDQISLEFSVIKNWNSEQIPAPKMVSSDKKSYLLETYYPGSTSLAEYLENNTYSSRLHNSVMDTLQLLHDQKCKHDHLYLHNDLHPENLLYSPEEHKVLAIDPGLLYKETLPFEDLSAYFDLFFLYSLQEKKYISPKTDLIAREYVSLLETHEKERMLGLNHFISDDNYKTLSSFASDEVASWWDMFTHKNFHKINSYLKGIDHD